MNNNNKTYYNINILLISLVILFISCSEYPQQNLVEGPVDKCRQNPKFLKKHGLVPPVYIDLRQKSAKGITIIEAKENGKKLRLPSWREAGTLGAYTMDDKGNILISPMPHVSLHASPLELENILYKVDTNTGLMDSIFKVPYTKPPNSSNPYGITGMTFDCESNYLYTSSVSGSNRLNEIGIISQINIDKKIVISNLKGVDAFGMSVFNTKHTKRLYFGLTRRPEIHSISLDGKGKFKGESRFEFSLLEAKGGGDDKAHKITISKDNIMTIKAIEFNYTLMAASDPLRNIYRYKYDRPTENWVFMDVRKQ